MICTGDIKDFFCCGLMPTFIIDGNAKYQLSENKEVILFIYKLKDSPD